MTEQELNKACEWLDGCLLPHFEIRDAYTAGSVTKKFFLRLFRDAMAVKEPSTPKYDADYLQSKIDAFTEARKKDGKTADEVLEECRGGALELTWQDIAEIIVAYGYVPKLNKDGSVRPAEDVFKDTLKRFREENK